MKKDKDDYIIAVFVFIFLTGMAFMLYFGVRAAHTEYKTHQIESKLQQAKALKELQILRESEG